MPKSLLRFVAVLLITCLIADPVTASTFHSPRHREVRQDTAVHNRYQEQAILPPFLCARLAFSSRQASAEDRMAENEQQVHSRPNLSRRIFITTILSSLLGASAPAIAQTASKKATVLPNNPLSPEQRAVLRREVDFFAGRYLPDMTEQQRQEIVDGAAAEFLIGNEVPKSLFWSIFGISCIFSLALVARAFFSWKAKIRSV